MTPEELAAAPPARLPFPVTRARSEPVGTERKADSAMPVLRGQFSTFDDPYEVRSSIEGHFLERIAPGAFDRTVAESRQNIKVLYDHGKDPSVGNKVLGPIEELTPDARYVVPLLDTSYNRDLAPGLEAGVYGSSFRFQVIADEWNDKPKRSASNPAGIPERVITEARVFEFGPVTFPANPNATAGTRSTTDDFYQRTTDPAQYESLLRSAQMARTPAPAVVASTTEGSPQTDARDTGSPQPDARRSVPTPDHKETRAMSLTVVGRADRPARLVELRSAMETITNEHDGVLPPEVADRWSALTAEVEAIQAADKADDERRAALAGIAVNPTRAAAVTAAGSYSTPAVIRERVADIFDLDEVRSVARNREDERQLYRDNAMRAIDQETFAHTVVERSVAQDHIAKLLDTKDSEDKELARRILQTGSPGYVKMFAKAVRGKPLTADEQRYAALEVVGTTTTGGYAVPYAFDPTIIPTGAYTNINPFRQICRVEQIVGANKWQGVSAGAVLAAYDTESDAVSEGGPTFSNPSVTVTRATAGVTLSYETMQDRPDILSELAALIGEAKDTLEENKFSVGAGSNNSPLGMFVKDTFTVKETITNDTFAVADLDATEAALPIRFRRDAVWMLSRGVIRIIQGWETAYGKLFNSTLGYPAVGNIANNPGGNTGLTLLGYPVWETPSAPTTVTTDDTIVGILVAPRNYLIVDRVGMEMEVLPKYDTGTGMPNGTRALLAVWRNSAKAVNADAGRQININ